MRTNIVIDDQLMEAVMATGDYKTKREAVEAGLRLIQRRKAYAAIRAARGTLQWDDSDEAWAQYRAEQPQTDAGPAGAVHEANARYLPAAGRDTP
ncbi:MAG: type II toxin-antitoxin system VapB family antitoxin [Burkholderiaceae bacterium]|jgi:Arc/MetJ family transcription regulator|nr:type II toxin-antitoxin system VapB family antitoxin [Burkholderiaceae bacterium]